MKKVVLCQIAALTLACASCSSKSNLYPVSGEVMYNGSPAAGATVFFHRRRGDQTNDQMLMGIVQEDGSFELVGGPKRKGAPPGEYDVLIEWRRSSGPRRGRAHQVPDVLKGRYADPKRPLLHATVEAKRTNLPPFELID